MIGRTLLAAVAIGTLSSPLQRFEYSQPHMGTMFSIVLYAAGEPEAKQAADAAFARIAVLDETLSDYRDSSELMRVSRGAGGPPVGVSEDLYRVLRASQALARASDGAFDVTAGPLTILWRAARRHRELPSDESLALARRLVGADKLVLDERFHTVTLRERGMQLDAGGIAKGFAADEATLILSRRGLTRTLVAAGGDIVAGEAPPGQEGWRVAVASHAETIDTTLAISNEAVSTSGDAEQHVEIAGVRYSHIVDPRTGTALAGRSSVTVVAPAGITSDGLATAVSVLGPEAGLRLVDGVNGASARISQMEAGQVKTYRSARWPGR